jgi:hypothetical protein
MDDTIDSVDSTEEGIHLREQLTQLLEGAGFIVRRWCSNDPEVLRGLPEEDKATGIVKVKESELPSVNTLGVLWSAEKDSFGFIGDVEAPEVYTKRTLLSKVATLFDPLQFLAPFSIRANIILQKTWMAGLGWDEELSEEISTAAQKWFQELKTVVSFSIPRHYFGGKKVMELSQMLQPKFTQQYPISEVLIQQVSSLLCLGLKPVSLH